MGVIKRFAVSSMLLGALAIAGGASALAFDGGTEQVPAVKGVEQPAPPVDEASDVPSDESSDELPDTGASISDSGAWDWFAPHGR